MAHRNLVNRGEDLPVECRHKDIDLPKKVLISKNTLWFSWYIEIHNLIHFWSFIVFMVTIVSFIPFFVFGHFWRQSYENTKILCNLCLHFARQDGQDGKKWKENHATKVTKIPKTKRRKYGMNKTSGKNRFGNKTKQSHNTFIILQIHH